MNDNPLLLAIRRAREEAEQRRIMERAPVKAVPLERLPQSGRDRAGDEVVMRTT